MNGIDENVEINAEDIDYVDGEEMKNFEELKLKGLNIIFNIVLVITCYISSFMFCVKHLYKLGFKLLLINSIVIVPLMFVILAVSYKKIESANFKILKSVVSKVVIYLFFNLLSLMFWMAIFKFESYKLILPFTGIVLILLVLMVHIGSIASTLSVILYNLEKEKKESMIDGKVVLNVNIMKVVPIIFLFALQLLVVLNTVRGASTGSMFVVTSSARLLSIGLTYGISLVVALIGLVAGIFNINIKEVYKYVLLSTFLGLFWSYAIIPIFIPIVYLHVLIGVAFGWVLNLITKAINKNNK